MFWCYYETAVCLGVCLLSDWLGRFHWSMGKLFVSYIRGREFSIEHAIRLPFRGHYFNWSFGHAFYNSHANIGNA
uniref:Uncharacterized protein n=1 Tax=Pararge aegeria TaxID=116150 RepID=S4P4S8_9NEOP